MDYYDYKVYTNGDIWSNYYSRFLKPSKDKKGYLVVNISINKKRHTNMKVHRLVALCYIPNPDNKPTVDHILCKEITNNNVSNLRWATDSEQSINRGINGNNTSGVKGVCKDGNSWRASLTINGKRMNKTFPTFEKAVAKRKEWELEFHQL